MYKLSNNSIIRLTDNSHIPISEDNRDYREYMEWTLHNTPEPADIVPVSSIYCSPRQMRKALRRMGLLNAVKKAVEQSTDEDLKDGWEYATVFCQDDPLCIAMAQALDADLTAVFQLAVTL